MYVTLKRIKDGSLHKFDVAHVSRLLGSGAFEFPMPGEPAPPAVVATPPFAPLANPVIRNEYVRLAAGGPQADENEELGGHAERIMALIPSSALKMLSSARSALSSLGKRSMKELTSGEALGRRFPTVIQDSIATAAKTLGDGVKAFVRGEPHEGEIIRRRMTHEEFFGVERELADQVEVAADGFTTLRQGVADALLNSHFPGIDEVAPGMSNELVNVYRRRVAFVASKLPRRLGEVGDDIVGSGWQPSRFELHQFARRLDVAEQPLSIVGRLNEGTLVPDDVETLDAVYPKLAQELRNKLQDELAERKGTRMPYRQRLLVSMVLGIRVDPALRPNVLAVLQGTYGKEAGTEGGMMPPSAESKYNPTRLKTPAESIIRPTRAQDR